MSSQNSTVSDFTDRLQGGSDSAAAVNSLCWGRCSPPRRADGQAQGYSAPLLGSAPGRPHGVYSCFIPASSGRITINGDDADGEVALEMRGDKQSSTACLAWSETWVRP